MTLAIDHILAAAACSGRTGMPDRCNLYLNDGDHVCAIYNSEDERMHLVARFLLEGIEKSHKIVYMLADEDKPSFLQRVLHGKDFDTARDAEASGQLKILGFSETYLGSGNDFGIDATINLFHEARLEALSCGYKNFRVTAEPTWIVTKDVDLRRLFCQYESKVNEFFHETGAIGLCQYNRTAFPADTLLNVLMSHPTAWLGLVSFQNFYYMPPTEYLSEDVSKSMLDRWINNLFERNGMEHKLNERTLELERANASLRIEMEERKKAECKKLEAEAMNKAKTDLLAVISHEMRTPLNGIIPLSQWLLSGSDLTCDQREAAEIIQTSANQLLSIISDVLDFCKFEHGAISLQCDGFDIRKSIADVWRAVAAAQRIVTFAHDAPAAHGSLSLSSRVNAASDIATAGRRDPPKGLSFAVSIPDTVPPLIVNDEMRVRQILFNLLSNACKFTADGGTITISAALVVKGDREHVTFTVADTGIGIAKDKWHIIFGAFSQVDPSMTRKYGGTGLGLAICRRILDAMGGSIWFESEVDRGSKFHFSIPLVVSGPQCTSTHIPMHRPSFYAPLESSPDTQCLAPSNMTDTTRDRVGHFHRTTAASLDNRVFECASGSPTCNSQTLSVKMPPPHTGVSGGVTPSDLTRKRRAIDIPGVSLENGSVRVLCAEDNHINQRVIVRLLSRMQGCQLTLVENGVEAVEAVMKHDYDCVLMDLSMPVLDGIAASEQISALPDWSNGSGRRRPRLVALTASALASEARCRQAGIEFVLSKPVRYDALEEAILGRR
eukprot:Opistho-2@40785